MSHCDTKTEKQHRFGRETSNFTCDERDAFKQWLGCLPKSFQNEGGFRGRGCLMKGGLIRGGELIRDLRCLLCHEVQEYEEL